MTHAPLRSPNHRAVLLVAWGETSSHLPCTRCQWRVSLTATPGGRSKWVPDAGLPCQKRISGWPDKDQALPLALPDSQSHIRQCPPPAPPCHLTWPDMVVRCKKPGKARLRPPPSVHPPSARRVGDSRPTPRSHTAVRLLAGTHAHGPWPSAPKSPGKPGWTSRIVKMAKKPGEARESPVGCGQRAREEPGNVPKSPVSRAFYICYRRLRNW